MKIALISDLHANLAALRAVLDDMPPVDSIVCCGDIIGYYPDVNEVCDEIRKLGVIAIRGNHDAYVTGHLDADQTKSRAYRVEWTRDVLSEDNFRWLSTLPVELKFCLDELRITIRHANFQNEEGYLYPDLKEFENIELAENEVVCFGHTHHPMEIKAGRGTILNPGSVGQPRDWNPDASYCIIDTSCRGFDFRRVPYDVAGFQKRLRELDWDTSVVDILSRRRVTEDEN